MKAFLSFVIAVFLAQTTIAQVHNELWTKYIFHAKISSGFSASLDLMLRQQANYLHHDDNIFSLPLMRSSRLWLQYSLPHHFSVLGSFFLARTFDIKDEEADMTKATEIRFNIGLSNKIVFGKTENQNRFLIETRDVKQENKSAADQVRYRLQNSVAIPLKICSPANRLGVVLANELFFKTQNSVSGFDQNRTSGLIQWHHRHCEYNIGFQRDYQSQNDKLITKNQILLIVNHSI